MIAIYFDRFAGQIAVDWSRCANALQLEWPPMKVWALCFLHGEVCDG